MPGFFVYPMRMPLGLLPLEALDRNVGGTMLFAKTSKGAVIPLLFTFSKRNGCKKGKLI